MTGNNTHLYHVLLVNTNNARGGAVVERGISERGKRRHGHCSPPPHPPCTEIACSTKDETMNVSSTSPVLPVAPCVPRSAYSCAASGGGPCAYRPSRRRCTCAAHIRFGIPSRPRHIRPPNRCCSRRTCVTGTYSGPNSWPKWPTCTGRIELSAIPVTLRSATNTTPTCSFGSFRLR